MRGGTSSAQKALFFNLRRLRAKLSRMVTRRMSESVYAEIAEAIGVSKKRMSRPWMCASPAPGHLSHAPIADGENNASERMDFLVDDTPLPDETVSAVIDAEAGARAGFVTRSGCLNERELRAFSKPAASVRTR